MSPGRLAEWLIGWRWGVVALSLLACGLAGAGLSKLHFLGDYRYIFTEDNPFLLAFDEVEAIALLEAVNLPAQFGTEARNLSIGEKQRLALVRALLVRPQVLLLDEPTSALDAVNREAVETLLKARVRDGLAVVVVTHDATQATRLCDRLVTLDDRGPTAQTPGGHPAPGSRHG